MNITQVQDAFKNGDIVYYAPQSVYSYLGWKREDMPGAPFVATTNIPHGIINQIMNTPTVVAGELVNNWIASVNGVSMPFNRLYISKDVFKAALKAALLTKVDGAAVIAARDAGYAESVDEIGIPVLAVSVATLDFSDNIIELTFDISNSGEGELDWTITTSLPAKVTASPVSGDTLDEVDTVTVTVDRSGVPQGTYNPTVDIVSDGGSASIELTVVVA